MAGYGGSGYAKGYPVPYHTTLLDKLEPGQTITIKGQVHEEPHMPININMKDDAGLVPFHISVRYDEKQLVMNTFKDGKWGEEVRKSIPFDKGGVFDLRIRCHQDEFEIDALGKNLHRYHYQVPLHHVTSLEVDGSITLSQVSWGGKYYSVPYDAVIKDGIPPGRQVTITGTPEKKAHEFQISLTHDADDVAMRLRVSFKDKKVYRNSYQDGKWQNEEKEATVDFPFQKDVQFDVVLVNRPFKIEAWINGEHYANFAHRMDPKKIKGLKIEGDVEISGIGASRM